MPEEVDYQFLKKFKEIIQKEIRKGKRFILVAGGGKTCRKYQAAAEKVSMLTQEDMDWLGIHVTRLNAHLLRTIFRKISHAEVITNPHHKVNFDEPILIAAGWRPGCSTDYDAVLLAKNYGVKKVINLSNMDYAYDTDPKKFKNAKIVKKISWEGFRKIVGSEWKPGMNVIFDPIASKEAEAFDMTVIIANGKKLKNFENILENKKFIGTVIN